MNGFFNAVIFREYPGKLKEISQIKYVQYAMGMLSHKQIMYSRLQFSRKEYNPRN